MIFSEFSSSEILNLILEELELRKIIASWGNVEQRMDNIDVLRKFALQYEEACNRLHSAASLGGFLLWLNDLEAKEKDMQGSGQNEDSVNVLTYHKSKGLEYPIVILLSLEGKLKDNVWGMHLVQEQEEVDLDNILGHRWLRYWINPYGNQSKNTPLVNRIEQSEVKKIALQKALAEEARLLYVGITRARDYLIFPTRSKPTLWLNRVWHQGNGDYPTLDATTYETPWEWKGKYLETDLETFVYGPDFTSEAILQKAILYPENRQGKMDILPAEIDVNKDIWNGNIFIKNCSTKIFNKPLKVKENANLYEVAKVQKAFLTADRMEYPPKDRQAMATAFLERYEVKDMLAFIPMLQYSTTWQEFLEKTFQPIQIHRKYPIQMIKKGRRFKTIIDTLVQTKTGWIIIQNTGFSGEQKKWRSKANELSLWLELSKQAIEQYFNSSNVQTYLHFVLNGGLMKVETEERSPIITTSTLEKI